MEDYVTGNLTGNLLKSVDLTLTYFHIAAGKISHLCGISLFHNTNLRGEMNKSQEFWESGKLVSFMIILIRRQRIANLNGRTPTNNEGGVVFPTQAAWVHVGPQTDVIPQHIGNPLFCADVIDFNPLKQTNRNKTIV